MRAAAIPGPRRKGAKDPFRGDRPLIGVLMNDDDGEDETTAFLLYSLSRHEVVRRATVTDGAVDFEANQEFIVIVSFLVVVLPMFGSDSHFVEHRRSTDTKNLILNYP